MGGLDGNPIGGMTLFNGDEKFMKKDTDMFKDDQPISETYKKFITRKKKFDKEFSEKTLINFALNIEFMKNEQKKVEKLVQQAVNSTEKTI